MLLALVGCSGRCGASRDAPPVARESPPAVAAPEASTVDAAASTACTSREADALARYKAYCADGGACASEDMNAPWKIADLDGDGVAEVIYSFGVSVSDRNEIYAGGNRCVHIATVGGGSVEREPTKHDGFYDFRVEDYGSYCEGSPCGCSPGITFYRHADGGYREVVERAVAGKVNVCDGG